MAVDGWRLADGNHNVRPFSTDAGEQEGEWFRWIHGGNDEEGLEVVLSSTNRWIVAFLAAAPLLVPGLRTPAQAQVVQPVEFPAEYVAENRDLVAFGTTEAFELAYIIFALTPAGRAEGSPIRQGTAYHEAVLDWFGEHADHAAVTGLGERPNLPRLAGNAVDFGFDGEGRLVELRDFGSLWGSRDLFREHLEAIGDFARTSGFLDFYAAHRPVYDAQAATYETGVDLAGMDAWLESEFDARRDAYRILFSPLTGGLHWTGGLEGEDFSEVRIVTAPPSALSGAKGPEIFAATLERMLFTEIDHNYVNPATDAYGEGVEAAFGDVDFWNTGQGYRSAQLTFNEYMTWAVYLVWARGSYDGELFRTVESSTIDFMEDRRGFPRFGSFVSTVEELYAGREEGRRLEDLYPAILEWAEAYGP